MNTVEKVFILLANSQKSENYIEKQIGLAQGSFKNWRNEKSKPSADALAKLADYFNVSTDYLLGRAENTPPKEFDFVEYLHALTWETLTPEQKQAIVKLVYGAEVERLEKENKDKK